METKHTPGPWSLCAHLDSPEIDALCPCVASIRGTIWAVNGEQIVCELGETPDEQAQGTWTPPFPREVTRANARLIAAAPELLEALEACETALCKLNWQDVERGVIPQRDIQPAYDLAVLAIRKAKGE